MKYGRSHSRGLFIYEIITRTDSCGIKLFSPTSNISNLSYPQYPIAFIRYNMLTSFLYFLNTHQTDNYDPTVSNNF